jgi:hypothetical protein
VRQAADTSLQEATIVVHLSPTEVTHAEGGEDAWMLGRAEVDRCPGPFLWAVFITENRCTQTVTLAQFFTKEILIRDQQRKRR